jgi:16S rRNA (uracil1498-N3)-methyltransferase
LASNRFFINQNQIHFPYIILKGDEHHHLRNVARIKSKTEIWLFDKNGQTYLAKVEDVSKSQTRLYILKHKKKEEPRLKICLAQALLKSKAMELVLQKSTELGIMNFVPILAERSVVKVKERINQKLQRWEKIAIEAAKQSGSSLLPEISPIISLNEILVREHHAKKLFLNEGGGAHFRKIVPLKPVSKRNSQDFSDSLIILNGPEGGWTSGEVRDIEEHGFEAVTLGDRILKAETAAICGVAILSHFWNT